jgi:hypothetical protein
MLQTIITLILSFIVFTFGSLLGCERATDAADHRNQVAA